MTGWIVALAVLVVAAVVIAGLWLRLRYTRGDVEDLRVAWQQADEALAEQRSEAVFGAVLLELAGQLPAAAHEAPSQPAERWLEALANYRKRVHDYDNAVRRCLQPLDLMPGAQGDDLAELQRLVGEARKPLFAARAALHEDDITQRLRALGERDAPAGDSGAKLVAALAVVAGAAREPRPVDLDKVVAAARELTQARHPRGPALQGHIHALPVLPAWPWFAPQLLRLLELGMRCAAIDTPAQLSASFVQCKVHLTFAGERAHAAGSKRQQIIDRELQAVRERFDEHGLELTFELQDPKTFRFSLKISVPDSEAGPDR